MTQEQLADVLKAHKKWATSLGGEGKRADLRRAVLSGADLSDAVLSGAVLSGAVLRRAVLSGADLSGADLSGADLSGAVLSGADLSGADLSGADLRRAVLSDAVLSGTVLQTLPTVWEWVVANGYFTRTLDGRTLVRAPRTRRSQHIGNTTYVPGQVYVAPYFSTCPTTACHPGLYVADASHPTDNDPIWVAYWLDESVVAGTPDDYKCRVRRFRALGEPDEFVQLTADDLEPSPVAEPTEEGK